MSDDLIRRSGAIKVLYQCTPFDPNGIALLEKCEKEIRAMPSADRPQGENLLEEYPSLFECSVCGASCFDTFPWDCNINFCPNCGARMKGADNE